MTSPINSKNSSLIDDVPDISLKHDKKSFCIPAIGEDEEIIYISPILEHTESPNLSDLDNKQDEEELSNLSDIDNKEEEEGSSNLSDIDNEEQDEDEEEDEEEEYFDLEDMADQIREAHEEEEDEIDIEDLSDNIREAEEMESLVNELIDAAQAKLDKESLPEKIWPKTKSDELFDKDLDNNIRSNKEVKNEVPFSVGKLEDQLRVPLIDTKMINDKKLECVNIVQTVGLGPRVWKIVRSNDLNKNICCTCVSWDEAIFKLQSIKNMYPGHIFGEFNILEVGL